jgi:hypothetical protein
MVARVGQKDIAEIPLHNQAFKHVCLQERLLENVSDCFMSKHSSIMENEFGYSVL